MHDTSVPTEYYSCLCLLQMLADDPSLSTSRSLILHKHTSPGHQASLSHRPLLTSTILSMVNPQLKPGGASFSFYTGSSGSMTSQVWGALEPDPWCRCHGHACADGAAFPALQRSKSPGPELTPIRKQRLM